MTIKSKHRFRWLIFLLLSALGVYATHARVFLRREYVSLQRAMEAVGGTCVYQGRIDVNDSTGLLYAYRCPDPCDQVLSGIRRTFPGRAKTQPPQLPGPRQGGAATRLFVTRSADGSQIYRFLGISLPEEQALVFCIAHEADGSDPDTKPSSHRMEKLSFPPSKPEFYACDPKTKTRMEISLTSASRSDVLDHFSDMLASRGWDRMFSGTDSASSVYVKGGAVVLVCVTETGIPSANRITVLHKALTVK